MKMSTAFEVTIEDLEQVIKEHYPDEEVDFVRLNQIFDELDHRAIEESALMEDDMEDQTKAAYDDIAEQLISVFDA